MLSSVLDNPPTSRYKELPGSMLVIVHFCPVHFWTVSSKPNSLSLLSKSSRHRFDFLFCIEPLWVEKEKEKKRRLFRLTLYFLGDGSTSFQPFFFFFEISACVHATGWQTLRRASLLTPFTARRPRRQSQNNTGRTRAEKSFCMSNKTRSSPSVSLSAATVKPQTLSSVVELSDLLGNAACAVDHFIVFYFVSVLLRLLFYYSLKNLLLISQKLLICF